LIAVPSRSLPQELANREDSPHYRKWRDQFEDDLTAQPCGENEPNFLTFLKSGNGLLQMRSPQQDGGCLLALS